MKPIFSTASVTDRVRGQDGLFERGEPDGDTKGRLAEADAPTGTRMDIAIGCGGRRRRAAKRGSSGARNRALGIRLSVGEGA